jgi:putative endonuclease
MFYTYVIASLKDRKHYIGYTVDIDRRIKQHNMGQVESTNNRRPFKLVYYEACCDEAKAIAREKYFKTGYGRRFLKSRI